MPKLCPLTLITIASVRPDLIFLKEAARFEPVSAAAIQVQAVACADYYKLLNRNNGSEFFLNLVGNNLNKRKADSSMPKVKTVASICSRSKS